eukprot:3287772-Prymnesium_polylepis.1
MPSNRALKAIFGPEGPGYMLAGVENARLVTRVQGGGTACTNQVSLPSVHRTVLSYGSCSHNRAS